MKILIILCLLIFNSFSAYAKSQTMNIVRVKYAGPFAVQTPFAIDSTNIDSKSFKPEILLDNHLSISNLKDVPYININDIPHKGTDGTTLNLIGFSISNRKYTTAKIKVEGIEQHHIYHNGKKLSDSEVKGNIIFEPMTHFFAIKYLANGSNPAISISLETIEDVFTFNESEKRTYTLYDVLHGTNYTNISLSPSGKFIITGYRTNLPEGKNTTFRKVTELETGRVLAQTSENVRWMPTSDKYYCTREGINGKQLIVIDPLSGKESILADNIPDGSFEIAPTEEYLLYTLVQKGPQEDKDVYRIIEPDDRQPKWRERTCLAKYTLTTGLMQPLTFGFHNTWATDISSDGRHILAMASKSRLTERPTTLYTLYLLDTYTCSAKILVEDDGFLNTAKFSPDGTKIVICGSPEALGGIGKAVEEGQIPSMYDYQLYIMDTIGKQTIPVTKNFNPGIRSFVWSKADGNIYFTAENRDRIDLYRINPSGYKIEQIETEEEIVNNFTVASDAATLAYYGQGASNSDRSYIINLKKGRTRVFENLSDGRLENVELGECIAWDFINSKGDTINGRYYLPPHFDANKKYPLIVNYYGGCSPTSRTFESRYPQHAYAALGYVVYVVNPSGATGFGQEFSARHVNTAGYGPAEDIIEGVKQFCKEHSFINDKKIGCIGASYGGFMTQYLQTQTDIFAAAISHAGISDHTSYWGEGYWGYSYSEVSMAGSYPWSHQELYVKQSPLYNAHKINTPILFLHGDADTNVPAGESIQMYTALKLLGKETELVLVKEQDHHILDYPKRIKWQNTIWAWFAKWLQDDPAWWNAMYPPKSL